MQYADCYQIQAEYCDKLALTVLKLYSTSRVYRHKKVSSKFARLLQSICYCISLIESVIFLLSFSRQNL